MAGIYEHAQHRRSVRARQEAPPPLEGCGYDTSRAAVLPMTLADALDAFEADAELTDLLGKGFTTSYLAYKRNEISASQKATTMVSLS
ncbi:hypothetical protein ACFLIM_40025 [Nonomuraea sp. M3C6]|uniref:GS catalytic domain-containing protein n=1 Tax=Nonomuraea marmarensis TaxID=3351344 RepID=A0ABW7APR4_9ACTN